MLFKQLYRELAYKHVAKKRYTISPNDGFMKQLKEYEAKLNM